MSASTEAIGASRAVGTEWSWGDDEPSEFDRPTLIPAVLPNEQELLESEAFASPPAERRTPPVAADSGLVPVGNSWGEEPKRQRYLSRDEIDSWSTTAPPLAAQRREVLPPLREDDPLAFELGIEQPDELSLELDVLYVPDSLERSEEPSRGPKTAPYPLNDWDELEETGVRPCSLPQQRREPITLPPPSTLDGLSDPLVPTAAVAALDFGPRGKSTGTTNPRMRQVDPVAELRDRIALGDFSGALVVAEGLLEAEPSNQEVARQAEVCREQLRAMYIARLGSLTHTPRVALPPDQVRWLSLDHRAGFLLSCVDGYSTIDEILDVSGMPPLDTLRILFELSQQRIISVD